MFGWSSESCCADELGRHFGAVNSHIYAMDKYFIRQVVFAIIIIALIMILLPAIAGLAVVGCFALAFLIYKRWRSKEPHQ